MTLIDKIQKKADIIARRYRDDIDFISVYAESDDEREDYGAINVEVNEWGGPKMRGGRIVGDHSDFFALCDLEKFLKPFGAKPVLVSEGDDIEHHRVNTYRVAFGDFAKEEAGK